MRPDTPATTPERARTGSLRGALVRRMLIIGCATILAAVGVLGAQLHSTSQERAQEDAGRRAELAARTTAELFRTWQGRLLVAASNPDYAEWYARPAGRAGLRPRIDQALVALQRIYPGLIDEACFIDAGGRELARQVGGVTAPLADLSPDESEAPFFAPTLALAAGQVYQTEPYLSEDSERWVMAVSTPIVVGGRPRGLLHYEARLDAVRALLDEELPDGMAARVLDAGSGVVVVDTAHAGEIVAQDPVPTGPWQDAPGPVTASARVDTGAGSPVRWTIEVARTAPTTFTGPLLLEIGLLLAVMGVLLVIAATRFGTSISRPLVQVTGVAEALAAGDLTRRATVDRDDEIGRMATALNQAIDDMAANQQALSHEYEARQQQLRNTETQRRRSEEQIRRRAQAVIDETAAAVRAELTHVTDQARRVQQGAAAIDEHVDSTSRATRTLVEQAGSADHLVNLLTDSLRRVGGIADLIAGVAEQTNLLALNATIEAARAGHAGRGFSVVAEEVKGLATETAKSTGEITETVGVLEQHARAVASAIASMAGNVTSIDDVTRDVTTVTREQKSVVEQLEQVISAAVGRMDSLTDVTGQLERRATERIAVHSEAVITFSGRDLTVRVEDLSETGARCAVAVGSGLSHGASVLVTLDLAGTSLSLPALVTNVQPAAGDGREDLLGVSFTDPAAAARGLTAYLDGLLGRDLTP